MFPSAGILSYDDTDGFRLTVEVDRDLADYYFSLIPKSHKAIRPRYAPHITVVRPEKEIPPKVRYWGSYEGEWIVFYYDSNIFCDKGYYWLNVWCKRLEAIREELGLPIISRWTLPPSGFSKCFHCTIGKERHMI